MTDRPPDATPPADAHGLAPGAILAGRYRIIELLGVGAMGAVYLAEHIRIGRKDAIKVLNAELASDREAIARFTRGARNVSAIRHPNICTIYDFSDTADGVTFLAMEYVPGETLRDVLQREGALPIERAVHITMQAALALQAAHDAGIVHRDLKPANIMVSPGQGGLDEVKVVDFDIAKGPAQGGGDEVTRLGFVVGTPEYMSPEQLMGEALDGRSDIYSLALVLYRMLTGVLPFQADNTQDLMIKRLTDQPLPLAAARPDLAFPPQLQAVLDRALQRKAADRYPSAAAFAEDLSRAIRGEARVTPVAQESELLPPTRVSAPPPAGAAPAAPAPVATTGARPRTGLYRAAAGAAAVVVLLLLVALYALGPGGDDPTPGGGDSDTPTQTAASTVAGDPPGGATETPEAPRGDAATQESSEPTGGGRTRQPVDAPETVARTEPAPPRPDPALVARQDSLALWRQFERLDALDLPESTLTAIIDTARAVYGRPAAPASLRAFAAYIAGLASVELGDVAACAAWLERAVRLRPDGPGYQEQLDACRGGAA